MPDKLIETLETAGLTFAAIPEGTYPVGYDGDSPPPARPGLVGNGRNGRPNY